MKTKLYSMRTLFIFITLVVLCNSFTQEVLSQPSVRLIYLHPNDRPAQPDKYDQLRQLVKEAQQFFADEMQRHGFDRRTFIFESNEMGEPLVHRVTGRFAEEHYNRFTGHKAWEEIREHFDFDELHHIYFIAIDIESPWEGKHCGEAGVTFWPSSGGPPQRRFYGTITQREEILGGFAVIPASGHCIDSRAFKLVAHELGHAFGLGHDFREGIASDYLMAYGNSTRLSKCAAEWLSFSPFFTTNSRSDNTPGEIQLISTPTYSPEGVRFRFEVADTNGLHQAQLLLPAASGEILSDCKQLEGETSTIEFISTELTIEPVDSVMLQIIDVNGSITWATFLVDIASLLPPPKVVSIPDANLATAVRTELGLEHSTPITDREMKKLRRLEYRAPNLRDNQKIADLTGLEAATNLESLNLYANRIRDLSALEGLQKLSTVSLPNNQIEDISPLEGLQKLKRLWLTNNRIENINSLKKICQSLELLDLGNNPIEDFSPIVDFGNLTWLDLHSNKLGDSSLELIAGLTQLQRLNLRGNQIENIGSLAKLTNLRQLYIADNEISDVRPLVNLINLEALYLAGNPIEDFSPLRTLLANNPNLKIDIDIPFGFISNFIPDQTFIAGTDVRLTLPIAASGAAPYTYSLSPIPAEFQFDMATQVLSGTPTTTGTTNVTYTATDATGTSAALNFTIEVISEDVPADDPLDVNSDGQVTVIDLAIVALFYGIQVPVGSSLPVDVNTDGVVDILDLTAVAGGIDAGGSVGLSLVEVEAGLLAAAEQAADLEAVAVAPMGFSTRPDVLSSGTAYLNVTHAFADARHLIVSDVLSKFLQLLAEMGAIPETMALLPNYPNPFNPETWIPYHLAQDAEVTLTIHDVRGVLVRELTLGHQAAGVYESRARAAYWDSKNESGEPVASGVYFYTLSTESTRDSVTAGDFTATRKLLIAK